VSCMRTLSKLLLIAALAAIVTVFVRAQAPVVPGTVVGLGQTTAPCASGDCLLGWRLTHEQRDEGGPAPRSYFNGGLTYPPPPGAADSHSVWVSLSAGLDPLTAGSRLLVVTSSLGAYEAQVVSVLSTLPLELGVIAPAAVTGEPHSADAASVVFSAMEEAFGGALVQPLYLRVGIAALDASTGHPEVPREWTAATEFSFHPPDIAFQPQAQTYDGLPRPVTGTAWGIPSSDIVISYGSSGEPTAPTDAGEYEVSAEVRAGAPWGGLVRQGTMAILRAPVTVTQSDLVHDFDGTPKSAVVTTAPADLPVAVTYDHAASPPILAGRYTVVATVTDPNHEGSATGSLIIQDTEAPTAVLDVPATLEAGTRELVVSGARSFDTGGGAIVRYRWTLDGGAPVETTEPTFTFVVDPYIPLGVRTVSLVVVDDSGNQSQPDTAQVIVRDTLAPTAVLDAPASILAGQPLTVSGARSSDVAPGQIVQYRWQLDSDPAVVTAEPSFTFTGVAAGLRMVSLVVVDDSGNQSAPNTVQVLVQAPDTEAPTAVLDVPATLEAGTRELVVSGARSFDTGGGRIVEYRWTLDGGAPVVTLEPAFTFVVDPYIPLGMRTVSLVVVDDAGNQSAPDTAQVLVRDTLAPTAVLDAPASIVPGQALTVSGARSFDVAPGRIVQYRWQLDSDPAVVTAEPSFTFTGVTAGLRTVSLVVVDDSGNQSAPDTAQVLVQGPDTEAPTAVLDVPATLEAGTRDLVASGARSFDTGGGRIVEYRWTLDGGAPVVTLEPAFTFVVDPYIPLGMRTVSLVVVDDAGNQSAPDEQITLVRDTTAPVLTVPDHVTLEAPGAAGVPYVFTATAVDLIDPSPVVICSPPSGSVFPAGTTMVTCTATDASGNSSTAGFTVTVDVRHELVGLLDPYAHPDVRQFKSGSTIPLKWKYADGTGVIDSAAFTPVLSAYGPVSCGVDSGAETTVALDAPGNSGLQYHAESSMWQFNWKTHRVSGTTCYYIVIEQPELGVTASFPVKLVR
jgi:PKD repeat protein